MFALRVPHEIAVLIVAGVLVVSRRLATRDVLGLVDWHLLLLFGCLFIVTAALAETGLPARLVADLAVAGLAALAPLTLAGNLLIVGSLANIIVVERARQAGVALSFGAHARCGIPMTLLSFAAAVAWFASHPFAA